MGKGILPADVILIIDMQPQSDDVPLLGELQQKLIRRRAGRAALGGEQLNHHRRILPIAESGHTQCEQAKNLCSDAAHICQFLNHLGTR